MGKDDAKRDPGLQAERTALAWSRTSAALLVNSLLVTRSGLKSQRHSLVGIGLIMLLAAGLVYLYSAKRRRELLADLGGTAPKAALIGACATIALAACAGGLASIALG